MMPGPVNPNWTILTYPSWTQCGPASTWYSQAVAVNNVKNSALGGLAAGAVVGGIIGTLLGVFNGLTATAATALAAGCTAGIAYCQWWLNQRLICLGGDRGALGAVFNVEPPETDWAIWDGAAYLGAYDTDYSFNLLLYGSTPTDTLPDNFVSQFSPPPWNNVPSQYPGLTPPMVQTWPASATDALKASWPSSGFPSWKDVELILPLTVPGQNTVNLPTSPMHIADLGLGFTGQYAGPPVTSPTPVPQGPLQSITVSNVSGDPPLPTQVSVPQGSSMKFYAWGQYAGGTGINIDISSSVNWSASGPTSNTASVNSNGVASTANGLTIAPANEVPSGTTTYPFPSNSLAPGTNTIYMAPGTSTITAEDPSSGVSNVAQLTTTAYASDAPPVFPLPTHQMLIHCEIEGEGMVAFAAMLAQLRTMFVAAAVVSAIPVVGPLVSLLIMLLALLFLFFGGPALQSLSAASPGANEQGDTGWTNPAYVDAKTLSSDIDILFVFGRWVFDSLHQPAGSNEIHPVHVIIKVKELTVAQLNNGDWPASLAGLKEKLTGYIQSVLTPEVAAIQSQPEYQWSLHPLVDGCQGAMSYAPPAAPPPPK
jgi:hypothetical protein